MINSDIKQIICDRCGNSEIYKDGEFPSGWCYRSATIGIKTWQLELCPYCTRLYDDYMKHFINYNKKGEVTE